MRRFPNVHKHWQRKSVNLRIAPQFEPSAISHGNRSPVCRSIFPNALPCGSSGPRPFGHRSRTAPRIFWHSRFVPRHCPEFVAWAALVPAAERDAAHCWPPLGLKEGDYYRRCTIILSYCQLTSVRCVQLHTGLNVLVGTAEAIPHLGHTSSSWFSRARGTIQLVGATLAMIAATTTLVFAADHLRREIYCCTRCC